MKIGIFTDSYKPYTSGVVTSISTFKEELTRLGHEVHIFAPSYPHYTEEEENVYRFYSVPSPYPDYTLAIPVYPGINILLRKLKLDIIHVHSPFTMGRVGLRYARKYHLPILFTYHTRYDQYVHYVPLAQDLAKELTIKYSSHFCNTCDHVIVPSADISDIVNDFSVRTPITVIPTGVPLQKFEGGGDKRWLREHYNIPEERRILLFVGRLTREKNLPFLLRTFAIVKQSLPDTTLVLTAQGPLEHDLKAQVTRMGLSLDTDVIFTGAVPFSTLVDVYYSADLFVFSSLSETQGLVVIEAMAAGLPVVAVRASGVQDMVDDGVDGLLTECNETKLSEAILCVLNDKELYERLKQHALEKAEQMSSRSMAIKLESVYESLLTHKHYRPSKILDMGSWFGM